MSSLCDLSCRRIVRLLVQEKVASLNKELIGQQEKLQRCKEMVSLHCFTSK